MLEIDWRSVQSGWYTDQKAKIQGPQDIKDAYATLTCKWIIVIVNLNVKLSKSIIPSQLMVIPLIINPISQKYQECARINMYITYYIYIYVVHNIMIWIYIYNVYIYIARPSCITGSFLKSPVGPQADVIRSSCCLAKGILVRPTDVMASLHRMNHVSLVNRHRQQWLWSGSKIWPGTKHHRDQCIDV